MTNEELAARLQKLEATQAAQELALAILLREAAGPTRAAVRHLARATLHDRQHTELTPGQREQAGAALLRLVMERPNVEDELPSGAR